MSMKSLLGGALLSVAAVGAQAAGGALGTIGSASFASGPLAASTAFSDVWTFSLFFPSQVAASVTNIYFSFGGSTFNDISGFSGMLDAFPMTLTTITPGGGTTAQLLSETTMLGAGPHTLTISGTAGPNGATYGGNIAAAPVPEPETLAMMLAGLGAVGFMARRRRQD